MFVEPVIASSNVNWTTGVFHESPQDNRPVVPSTGFTFGDIVQFYIAYKPFHITCLASIWDHCVQYMGICYVIMFEGYNARTGTFFLCLLHHIWSHQIPSTHIQYISNMSQQHATASSPIPTSEDHAEGVIAHAAKVIMQYTNGLKQHNNPEYWNKTTQVVWDELVSLGTYLQISLIFQ